MIEEDILETLAENALFKIYDSLIGRKGNAAEKGGGNSERRRHNQ
ncbi:MAG: hypothetical protein AMXMBFR16_00830 [Candidatus Uhrbacteria bacterium]